MQLSELAADDSKLAVVGAVKETGVADAELLKFYDLYFRHSIYKDDRWQVYKAMGGRTLSWPQLIAGSFRAEKRYKRKGIDNKKFGGDLHMQGGLLIFDKQGRLRYAYKEEYGEELDMEIVKQAIAEIRQSGSGEPRPSCAVDRYRAGAEPGSAAGAGGERSLSATKAAAGQSRRAQGAVCGARGGTEHG